MKVKLVDIGYGNLVAADRVLSVASPDAAPIKRMVADGKKEGRVIDLTAGQKTKAVLFSDCDYLILSPLSPEELGERLNRD